LEQEYLVITGTGSCKYSRSTLILFRLSLAAFSCTLSALCYAEFVPGVTIGGGAYGYHLYNIWKHSWWLVGLATHL